MTQEERDATRRLDEALGRLPRSVDPSQDLWPAIEARLREVPARSRRTWAWQVAAALVLVTATAMLTASLVRRQDAQLAGGIGQPPAELMPAAFGPAYSPDPAYLAARQQLVKMVEERVGRLPPPERRKLETNLAEIRRATAEIKSALALQPGDPLLEELLLNSYQDELAVLASVNDLTGTNGVTAPLDDKRMQL